MHGHIIFKRYCCFECKHCCKLVWQANVQVATSERQSFNKQVFQYMYSNTVDTIIWAYLICKNYSPYGFKNRNSYFNKNRVISIWRNVNATYTRNFVDWWALFQYDFPPVHCSASAVAYRHKSIIETVHSSECLWLKALYFVWQPCMQTLFKSQS